MNRRYHLPRETAAEILKDIALTGESTGWSGSEELLIQLEQILDKFNVEYVDDFHGTWKLKVE
jgi:hypothetical protein